MSQSLTDLAVIKFDADVKREYQDMGAKLEETITLKTDVIGESIRFQVMKQGMASQHIARTDIVPMQTEYTKPLVELSNWVAGDYTDVFEDCEVNFDEREKLSKNIGGALVRREEQMVLDAALGKFTDLTKIPSDFIFETFTLEQLLFLKYKFDDANIPDEGRYIVIGAYERSLLLGDTKVTSSDYNTIKALVNGEIDSYCGFKFRVIGRRNEGGLPTFMVKDINPYKACVAYHKDAIGLARAKQHLKTKVSEVPEKFSWLTAGRIRSGAGLILPEGCFPFGVKDGRPVVTGSTASKSKPFPGMVAKNEKDMGPEFKIK